MPPFAGEVRILRMTVEYAYKAQVELNEWSSAASPYVPSGFELENYFFIFTKGI
jgi:hypothetical protein